MTTETEDHYQVSMITTYPTQEQSPFSLYEGRNSRFLESGTTDRLASMAPWDDKATATIATTTTFSTTTTPLTEKKVRFERKARRKVTMSIDHYTRQERRNTWYSREELNDMYRDAERSLADSMDSSTDMGTGIHPLFSRRTVSVVRPSPMKQKAIEEDKHKYLTTKEHADLMGLTPRKCKDLPPHPPKKEDPKNPTTSFGSKNRRSFSIVRFFQWDFSIHT